MTDYDPHPRNKYQRRYWYLANGEVLNEPDLLSTPAGRRMEIVGFGDAFWSSDLTGMLDTWAEAEAEDRDTQVMAALSYRQYDDNEDNDNWVHDKFVDAVLNKVDKAKTFDETFRHGSMLRSQFAFAKGADVVVFSIFLQSTGTYYSGNRGFKITASAARTKPQSGRLVTREDSPSEFSTTPHTRELTHFDIEDLLGEEFILAEEKQYDHEEYVQAAAEFCRASMQIADFTVIGDGLQIEHSVWNPNYVQSLQQALTNEEPLKRLRESLEGVRDALQDMGFQVDKFTDSDLWNLASNGASAPLLLNVKDHSDRPPSIVIVDFPTGRIHAERTTINSDMLTMYEIARSRAERDGNLEVLDTALAFMNSREAFKKHDKAKAAAETALKILPN